MMKILCHVGEQVKEKENTLEKLKCSLLKKGKKNEEQRRQIEYW